MADVSTGGFLAGKKTYIAGAMGVLGAIAAYLSGDATLVQAAQLVLTAVLGMTVHHAVAGS